MGYNPSADPRRAAAGMGTDHRRLMRFLTPYAPALAALLLTAACASAPASGGAIGHGGSTGEQMRAAADALAAGRNDEAARRFRHIVDDPATPDTAAARAWHDLGVALSRNDQREEAVDALEEAVRRAPELADAHLHLAQALRATGRYTEAEQHYLEARKRAPERLDIVYNLGILYELYLNQPDKARAAYRVYVDGGGEHAERVRSWIDTLGKSRPGKKGS